MPSFLLLSQRFLVVDLLFAVFFAVFCADAGHVVKSACRLLRVDCCVLMGGGVARATPNTLQTAPYQLRHCLLKFNF
jgi:hypothetical protein